jgi:transcriptional regulator with XRE-family HTH domain
VIALEAVATNVQKWRIRRGLSVSALARASGLSKSTVSGLERHFGNPSLDTLWALARALEIPLGFLFSDSVGDSELRVLKSDDHRPAFRHSGYASRLVTGWRADGELELYVTTIDATAQHDSESHGAGVIEYVLVVDGDVKVHVGGQEVELEQGDFLSFAADKPHSYRANGPSATLVGIHQYPRGGPHSEVPARS